MTTSRRQVLLVATIALLATLPAGVAATGSSESVTLAEFTLTPQTPGLQRAAGTWTFTATNAGSFTHTLNVRPSVGGADLAATGLIAPGSSATLPALDLAPGGYRLYCALHPSAMHVDLVLVGVPTSGPPTVDAIGTDAATVHVVANAAGDTAAVARLHVAPAATPTAGTTVEVPLSGFAETSVSHLFSGLSADTEYVVQASAHGAGGDSVVRSTTFHTGSGAVYAPTLALLLPTSRSVAAWRIVRGSLDAGTAAVAAVEVNVLHHVHRRCLAYVRGHFQRGPCGGPPRSFAPALLAHGMVTLRLSGLRPGLVRVMLRAVDASGAVLATSGPVWRRLVG